MIVEALFKTVYDRDITFSYEGDLAAAITWARELMGLSKKLLTPGVVDAVIEKVNAKRVTNSKDLRRLRAILPDPVAREHFLSGKGDLDSAVLRIAAPVTKDKSGFASDLDAAVESMKRVPWDGARGA